MSYMMKNKSGLYMVLTIVLYMRSNLSNLAIPQEWTKLILYGGLELISLYYTALEFIYEMTKNIDKQEEFIEKPYKICWQNGTEY